MNSRKAAVLLTIAAIAFMLYLFRQRIVDAWKKATEKLTPDSTSSGSGGDAGGNDTSSGSGGDAGGATGSSGGGSNDPDCAACGMSEGTPNTSILDEMLPQAQGERIYRVFYEGVSGGDGKIRGDYGKVLVRYGIVNFAVKVRQADGKPVTDPRPSYRVVAELRNTSTQVLDALIVSQPFNFSVDGEQFPVHSFKVIKKTTETGQETTAYLPIRTRYSITAWIIDAQTGAQISDSATAVQQARTTG